MSKHEEHTDDLPETWWESVQETFWQIVRLKGLLALVALVGVSGWIWLDEYIEPAFARLWLDLVKLWDEATITAIIRGIFAYISRFGWRLILFETAKRVLIWLAITKLIVWLLPWQTRLQMRWWMRDKKNGLFDKIRRAREFLSRPDMFGRFFGIALWLLLTLIVLVLFYSFFWLWTMIVLGFIRLPGVLNRAAAWVWQKITWAVQKSRFMKFLLRAIRVAWQRSMKWLTTPLLNLFPKWHLLKRDEESLRRRRVDQIRQMRALIRMRKNKELWWQAKFNKAEHRGYRELRAMHGHDVSISEVLPRWVVRLIWREAKVDTPALNRDKQVPQLRGNIAFPCCTEPTPVMQAAE